MKDNIQSLPSDVAAVLGAPKRLAALDAAMPMFLGPDPDFDDIAALAAALFSAPISLVTILGRTDQWFLARQGTPEIRAPSEDSFCARMIALGGGKPLILADARADSDFSKLPSVTDEPHLRFYAGVPIIADGEAIGTVCVFDTKPHARTAPDLLPRLERLASLAGSLIKLKEEARRRLRGGGAAGGAGAEEADAAAGEIAAYAAASEYPKAGRQCQITIDKAHDAVLLPMFGTLVPFHVSTIKSVVKADEGPKTFLRLNFFAPGQAVGKDAAPAMAAAVAAHGDAIFVRTLNFMSRDGRNMSNVVNLIKVMQKKLKTDRDEEKLLADLKEQPKLVIVPGASVPQLRDLSMYPPISGRKTRGVLRAHSNGVRLTSDKGETVDLIYANVRHAVFQPCEREHVVLIHFHLKAPILINKKKVKDVQFFTEVVEQSQAIDGRHGSEFDADEMAEEERERRVRYELNKGFRSFMEAVHRISALPFETTTSSLMFTGAPLREMVNIMLCQECLVAVVDRPPFVVSVKDMEHVCFERVSVAYHTKTFDMVIIFKAGTRDKGEDEFVRITSIPIAALDLIKGWLDETAEVTFTELPQPMNWKLVIEGTVRKPDFYLSEGEDGEPKLSGWIQLLEDVGDGDDEEEDEEEESEYGGSSDEEEEESEEEEEDDDEFDDNVTDDDVRMRMCLCVWDAACLSLTDAPHPAHPINCRMMSMTTARTTTATRRTGTSWTDAPRRMTASASGKKTRRTRRSGPSATSMPSGRGIRAVRGARAWLGAGCGSCVRGHTIVIIGVPVLVAAVPQCGVCLQF